MHHRPASSPEARSNASPSRARSSTIRPSSSADEPTGDLDRKSADEILALLETLNKEFEKTILMVTHDPQVAERARVEMHLEKGALKT